MLVITAITALGLLTGSPALTDAPVQITDGTYVVGTDIPAGTYRTDGTGSLSGDCYWALHKNDGGAAGDIIKNHVGAGIGSVNARAGQVLELSLGCTYTKS